MRYFIAIVIGFVAGKRKFSNQREKFEQITNEYYHNSTHQWINSADFHYSILNKLRKSTENNCNFRFNWTRKKNIWTGCCCCSCFQIWHCDYVVKWIESTVQKNPRYWYMAASVCVLYTMFESSLSKWAHPMLQHARICVDWAFVCMCGMYVR